MWKPESDDLGTIRRMLGLEIDRRAVVDLYVNQGMPPQLSSKSIGRDAIFKVGARDGPLL